MTCSNKKNQVGKWWKLGENIDKCFETTEPRVASIQLGVIVSQILRSPS